jgi:hypothetical protein
MKMSTPDSPRWLKHPEMMTYRVPVLSVGAALIIARWLDMHFHDCPIALHLRAKPCGLGMGLAISRSIIESHRGRLWAKPNPDYGTTFHLALPGMR